MEDKKDILESLAGVAQLKHDNVIKDDAIENIAQYYCDSMTDENINDVLGDYNTHLVTLVGFSEVGKSTFVASLYHKLMCTGEIDGYNFIDSDTYVGFERRAYIRNESLKTSYRNSRTTTLEGQFLTLTLSKDNKINKLIISDRAGETYKNSYTSNLSDVKQDKGLINSHHIIFFIDSSSVNNEDDYSDFCDDFQLLLSRMASAGVFDVPKVYDIIYNKIDLNQTDEIKELYKKQSQDLENKMKVDYGIDISSKFEIVANDMKDQGLGDVFKFLVNTLDSHTNYQYEESNWVKTLLNE